MTSSGLPVRLASAFAARYSRCHPDGSAAGEVNESATANTRDVDQIQCTVRCDLEFEILIFATAKYSDFALRETLILQPPDPPQCDNTRHMASPIRPPGEYLCRRLHGVLD